MKVFITGISGTGKTTTLAELQKHGYVVIDLDATGMCRWKNKATGEITEYGPVGRDYQWLTEHGWYCDIPTLKTLLSSMREDKDVFVSGITENIEDVIHEFDKVFILTADDTVIKDRLSKRSNNHFAKNEDEQAFVLEHSRKLLKKMEDFIVIETDNLSVEEVADTIIKTIGE